MEYNNSCTLQLERLQVLSPFPSLPIWLGTPLSITLFFVPHLFHHSFLCPPSVPSSNLVSFSFRDSSLTTSERLFLFHLFGPFPLPAPPVTTLYHVCKCFFSYTFIFSQTPDILFSHLPSPCQLSFLPQIFFSPNYMQFHGLSNKNSTVAILLFRKYPKIVYIVCGVLQMVICVTPSHHTAH